MNILKTTMKQAVSGMELQSQRLGTTAENISNADTPGYQRKLLVPQAGNLLPGQFRQVITTLDQTEGSREFDPTHPLADQDGYLTSSNVSVVVEMADMREANRVYEANLNSFQQAKGMYQSLLDILKR
jgi:flagellar basal-body rod protein FlgC